MEITHALIIREPWIGKILSGSKTWEMRRGPTPKRGPIALIRQGTGLAVAIAELVECLPALSAETMKTTEQYHAIPAQEQPDALTRNWTTPWVLRNVRPLAQPVNGGQRPGAVTWVRISETVQASINKQLGGAL